MPGDFIGDLPVNSFIHPAGLPITTSSVEVLRRPVESTQYVSLKFGQSARQAGIAMSMGATGDAYDNALAETFFSTLKKELINRRTWPTRHRLQTAVFDYIETFYNRQRRHSTLGYLSPVQYEQLTLSNNIRKTAA